MINNYTRQRQGRDFSQTNYLQNAEMSLESNYNQIDGIINNTVTESEDKKKSMLDKLEIYKQEAERNAVPVDGFEPPERGI
jgi:hypothetical protein